MTDNIHPIFDRMLSREERQAAFNQTSKVLWMTGLSGSGKSTIAVNLERRLFDLGFFAQILDGDNIRSGINSNLGFSLEDRKENIRRISEIAKLYVHSGIIPICSFVSPTNEIREQAQEIIGHDDFLEVFVSAPIEVCEARDVKGLYAKARRGEIKGFTGIDSPFEPPKNPFLDVPSHVLNVEQSVELILTNLLPVIRLK